jgi:Ca2+-binding RTX toxin-like protein
MRRIDERLNLSASAAPRLDTSNLRAPAEAQAALTAVHQAHAAAGVETEAAADGVQALDGAPVHATLLKPGIGLGYATLDTIQDQDVAFVMTDHGLATITSGAQGYLVKSDVPMDAALAKILGFNAPGAAFADIMTSMAQLSPTAASDSFDHGHEYGWDIKGGAAGDTVTGSQHNDFLHGLAGNDSLDGAAGDDIVWAGTGADTMFGAEGDDQLMGGVGNDSMDGGLDSDLLFAGSGIDTLQGGDGDDLLLGMAGKDSLVGGAGADMLVGGADGDVLTGLDGADIFLFAQGDSGVGDAAQDRITDFAIGEDRLDLTSFREALHLVEAFGHHAYELVMTDRPDGTLIQIDLNGDGVSDQEIVVVTTDHAQLSSGDLVI